MLSASLATADGIRLGPLARRERGLVLAVCAAVWLGALLYSPYVHAGPALCPLRLSMGLPCPACGLTRAFCSLVSGHPLQALWWNALCAPLALLFAVAPAVALFELAADRSSSWYRPWLFSPRVARVFGVLVAVYHVGRCGVWFADGTLAREFFPGSLAAFVWRMARRGVGLDS